MAALMQIVVGMTIGILVITWMGMPARKKKKKNGPSTAAQIGSVIAKGASVLTHLIIVVGIVWALSLPLGLNIWLDWPTDLLAWMLSGITWMVAWAADTPIRVSWTWLSDMQTPVSFDVYPGVMIARIVAGLIAPALIYGTLSMFKWYAKGDWSSKRAKKTYDDASTKIVSIGLSLGMIIGSAAALLGLYLLFQFILLLGGFILHIGQNI